MTSSSDIIGRWKEYTSSMKKVESRDLGVGLSIIGAEDSEVVKNLCGITGRLWMDGTLRKTEIKLK